MPNSVDITKEEWEIVRSLRDEFRNAVKENDILEFSNTYKDAIKHDEYGTMLVRRVRNSGSFDSQSSGIRGLNHSFMVTPCDDIIGFGRSNEFEDSVLGQGSFGRVREAKIKLAAEQLETEPGSAAVKVVVSKSAHNSPLVEHEIEVLEEFGQLKGHMQVQVQCKGAELHKNYIALEKFEGQNLREIARPEVTLSKLLRPLLTRERQQNIDRNDDSLHVALRTYQQRAKNPLAWKTENNPLCGIGYVEPIKRFWREFLKKPNLPEHAKKLGLHINSIIKQNERLRLENQQAKPYLLRVEYAIAAARALKAFHEKQFIHRDIKGLNLMGEQHYIDDKTITTVNIIDLATAVHVSRADKPEHIRKDFVGTVAYASPELLANIYKPELNEKYSYKSDIFALGKTFELDLQLQYEDEGRRIIEQITAMLPTNRPDLETIIDSLVQLKKSVEKTNSQQDRLSYSM